MAPDGHRRRDRWLALQVHELLLSGKCGLRYAFGQLFLQGQQAPRVVQSINEMAVQGRTDDLELTVPPPARRHDAVTGGVNAG